MITRRKILAGIVGLPVAGLVSNVVVSHVLAQESQMPETLTTSAGDLLIYPVEHASLVLQMGDKVIYLDPVGGAELYADLPPPTAIMITHGHGDHFDIPTLEAIAGSAAIVTNEDVFGKLPETLKANAKAVANGAEGEVDGLSFKAIAAHNTTEDRMRYHPIGVGNGYVITFGDKVVYVAGDTEPTDDMLALTDIDVAFLPMNLPYTMTPDQAAEAINVFKPAIVYPYHYGDSDLSVLEGAVGDHTEIRLRNWYPNGQA